MTELQRPLIEDRSEFLDSADEDGLYDPDLAPELISELEPELLGSRRSKASIATSLVRGCRKSIEDITNLKLSLLTAQKEKAEWEAEQDVIIATLDNLRNEHQRKGYLADKKYEAGSPWPALMKKVEELKVEIQKNELQLQLNLHTLRLIAKGIVIHD
jgi:hypothetical protein